MGRHKLPDNVAEFRGAKKHDPQRYRNRVPKPKGPIGNAPRHWPKEVKDIWKELIKLAPPGVLTLSDRLMVEIAVRLIVKVRTHKASAAELGQCIKTLGLLGFSPVDRTRIHLGDQAEPGTFDEF